MCGVYLCVIKGFIKLAYFTGWIFHKGHLQGKEPEDPVAAQNNKLQASEQERSRMHYQPESKGLESLLWESMQKG